MGHKRPIRELWQYFQDTFSPDAKSLLENVMHPAFQIYIVAVVAAHSVEGVFIVGGTPLLSPWPSALLHIHTNADTVILK